MFLWPSKKKSFPPNSEARHKGAKPSIILIHYTGMEDPLMAFERLNDPLSKVSAHYMIDTDGCLHDIVPEEFRAWHAGVSYWDRETDINSHSIGIELDNPGHEFGYRAFPQEQMDSLLKLCREIMARHEIKHVLGHSDVAPERKTDPGELFDWKWMAAHGVGLWPDITPEDEENAVVIARNDFDAMKLFHKFGYQPAAASVDIVTAFHRHYYPQRFEEGKEGQVCEQTIARLLSLMRQVGKKP
ncbi:MAG: N-acetylmuramoyl-L-alanine amidase [Alphaproteobacteria bacterium]|nr:N-acetylmuramoyl-L-alanine amidase [Alphaproteobacteria bacterium]